MRKRSVPEERNAVSGGDCDEHHFFILNGMALDHAIILAPAQAERMLP
jgi:hypothetical protein